ncbi:T9SS type A sorting domain-containing protein [Flavobacterium dankookense]|uniref:Putative delta-60 repeat protein/predicted secreted protein (Por secretion system target) n=1 Tax=Flavobacterium dankookense TaxID=706186 RepID=A0A4R6QFP1_9FLAO|nr:T9SS type A sorting domain-containing protein [Flavobacterium dankookense]TDP61117.1 putative delta-60 repeat protein/predicted secreted protein (Por secretion system target) [Flavobacterium dankookense]
MTKKFTLFFLFYGLLFYSQNIDNSFNFNNSGPYNENIGGYGIVLDNGNIITYDGYCNLLNSNGGLINNAETFIEPIQFNTLINGSNNKLVAYNWENLGLQVYNIDGSEDTNFITPIFTSALSPSLSCVKMDPDGKIVVSGYFDTVNGIPRKNMVRLNPNGSVDTSFINIDDELNFSGSVNSFIRQSDGKYIIGGKFRNGFSGNYHNISLTRLNNDGSIDESFYDFTDIFYGFGSDDTIIKKILIQPDGKILIIGPNFKSGSSILSNAISRLNSNGTRDTTFNSLGIGFYGDDALVLPDGKIIISYGINNLKKLNTNGSVDNSFNYQNTEYYHQTYTGLQLSDNKILINCPYLSIQGITREKIHRINSSGSLDYTFNPQQSTNKPIQNMAVLNDGSILIESNNLTSYNDISCKSLIKLNSEGNLNPNFNLDSQVQSFTNDIFHFKEFSNNKILVTAGYNSGSPTNGSIYINSNEKKYLRLNDDGSIDNSFNPTINVDLRCSEILNNDKILYLNYSNNKLFRLNYDGTNDLTFTPYTFYSNSSFKKFKDGSIYIYGNTVSNFSKIRKINYDGTINLSYNSYNLTDHYVKSFQKQNDKLIVNYYDGYVSSQIKRLNPDGSLDTSFNSFTTGCEKIIINSENKILIIYSNLIKKYSENGDFEDIINLNFEISKVCQQFCDKLLIQGESRIDLNSYSNNFDNLTRYDISSNAAFVNTPTGSPIQNFLDGDTLQNLNVSGENIAWYENQIACELNINTNETSSLNTETPLSLDTVLINNTIYYASQTVNNIESTYRLPVKAVASLNITIPEIPIFKVLNPIKDFLEISGNENIKKVEIYNMIGHNLKNFILENEPKEVEIDIKDLIPNIYILKILSSNNIVTKKIIKQ